MRNLQQVGNERVHVSRVLPNTHFDKQKFAAITVRLHAPMCTVLLFTSGKLVLTGSKTFADCILACHRVLRLPRPAGTAARGHVWVALTGCGLAAHRSAARAAPAARHSQR